MHISECLSDPGGETAALSSCLLLYGEEPIWRIPKACPIKQGKWQCGQNVSRPQSVFQIVKTSVRELLFGYRLYGAETGTEKSRISDSFRTI